MDANRTGTCRLTLVEASGAAWTGDTLVRIEDDAEQVIYAKRKRYERSVLFTALRTPPRGRHMFHVKTTVHVPASTYVQVPSDGEKNAVIRLAVHYQHADQHAARIAFPAFGGLKVKGLDDVHAALDDPEVPALTSTQVPIRRTPGPVYYDDLVTRKAENGNHRRLACLLNLYTKLKRTQVDDDGFSTWNFIDKILCMEQDRMFATVKPGLVMDDLLKRLEASSHFGTEDSKWHDIDPPLGFQKHGVTFKSREAAGAANLQLSFASRKNGGETEWMVDVDIDEKTGVGHWGEVIYHWVTGARTNPYAVHQLLCLSGHLPPYSLIVDPASP